MDPFHIDLTEFAIDQQLPASYHSLLPTDADAIGASKAISSRLYELDHAGIDVWIKQHLKQFDIDPGYLLSASEHRKPIISLLVNAANQTDFAVSQENLNRYSTAAQTEISVLRSDSDDSSIKMYSEFADKVFLNGSYLFEDQIDVERQQLEQGVPVRIIEFNEGKDSGNGCYQCTAEGFDYQSEITQKVDGIKITKTIAAVKIAKTFSGKGSDGEAMFGSTKKSFGKKSASGCKSLGTTERMFTGEFNDEVDVLANYSSRRMAITTRKGRPVGGKPIRSNKSRQKFGCKLSSAINTSFSSGDKNEYEGINYEEYRNSAKGPPTTSTHAIISKKRLYNVDEKELSFAKKQKVGKVAAAASRVRRAAWSDHEQDILHQLLVERRQQEAKFPELSKFYDNALWDLMSKQLWHRFGIKRLPMACKNHWGRKGRNLSGFDERSVLKRSNNLETSLQASKKGKRL